MIDQYFFNLYLKVSFEVLSLELKIINYTNLDLFFPEIFLQRFGHVAIKYFMDFMLVIYLFYVSHF